MKEGLKIMMICLLLAGTLLGRAEPWTVTVRAENDLPANTDHYYTNGASIAYAHCATDCETLPAGLMRLTGLDASGRLSFGMDFGQVMVTPTDTQLVNPDPSDRPYAGLLFAGLTWQRFSDEHLTAFRLITGMVGPASLAEETQKTVHRTIGVQLPQGWGSQLRNEPILNAVLERRWRAKSWGYPNALGGDLLLVGGGMLGNVLTQAYGQAQIRVGWRVPHDYGTSLIRGLGAMPPAREATPWSLHGFAAVGGLGIARNITLDGNTFRDGPSVAKRPWVGTMEAGVALRGRTWQLTASWVSWGREFDAQLRHSEFGTLTVSVFR
jgi:lipid A 3-O-deacylase